MSIKDKDGNVYRLRGPNPLVKNRSDWDKNYIKLINIGKWKSEVLEDKNKEEASIPDIAKTLNLYEGPEPPVKTIPANEFLKEVTEVEQIKEPTLEIKQEEKQEEKQEQKTAIINVPEILAQAIRDRGVEYYCAPVIGENKFTDDLYGSTYKTNKYGNKFLFDAIVIDQSDLQLQFWCLKDLTKNSIVYKKNQQGGERWWRITDSEPKTGGFICLATVSDMNPDFS